MPDITAMDYSPPAPLVDGPNAHGEFSSQPNPNVDVDAERPTVTIEEVDDDDFVDEFDPKKGAGAIFGKAPTTFERIRDDQILIGAEVLGPFESDEEWELAKWLIKNVGHNQAEAFLKLPIVSSSTNSHDLQLTP